MFIFKKNNKKFLLHLASALLLFAAGKNSSANSGKSGTVSVTQFLGGAAVVTGVGILGWGLYRQQRAAKFGEVTNGVSEIALEKNDEDRNTILYTEEEQKVKFEGATVFFTKDGKYQMSSGNLIGERLTIATNGRYQPFTYTTVGPLTCGMLAERIEWARCGTEVQARVPEKLRGLDLNTVHAFAAAALQQAGRFKEYERQVAAVVAAGDCPAGRSFDKQCVFAAGCAVNPRWQAGDHGNAKAALGNLRARARALKAQGVPQQRADEADWTVKVGAGVGLLGGVALLVDAFCK